MRAITLLTLLAVLALPQSALAEESYDSSKAGHPVRVAAYAAHPVGVILDYMIFRPAWYIGGKEPFRTLFGRAPLPPHEQAALWVPEPLDPEAGAVEPTSLEPSHLPTEP